MFFTHNKVILNRDSNVHLQKGGEKKKTQTCKSNVSLIHFGISWKNLSRVPQIQQMNSYKARLQLCSLIQVQGTTATRSSCLDRRKPLISWGVHPWDRALMRLRLGMMKPSPPQSSSGDSPAPHGWGDCKASGSPL